MSKNSSDWTLLRNTNSIIQDMNLEGNLGIAEKNKGKTEEKK